MTVTVTVTWGNLEGWLHNLEGVLRMEQSVCRVEELHPVSPADVQHSTRSQSRSWGIYFSNVFVPCPQTVVLEQGCARVQPPCAFANEGGAAVWGRGAQHAARHTLASHEGVWESVRQACERGDLEQLLLLSELRRLPGGQH